MSCVEELDWPSLSPDLNPFKHLWVELEWRPEVQPGNLQHRVKLEIGMAKAELESWM